VLLNSPWDVVAGEPHALALSRGGLQFASSGGWVLSSRQGQQRAFGGASADTDKLRNACGVAVGSAGLVFVCDEGADRVRVFDEQGTAMRDWYCSRPMCVAVCALTQTVHVGNSTSVRAYSEHGKLLSWRSATASGLAVDRQGLLYSVHRAKASVRVVAYDGKLVREWSGGQLRSPCALAIGGDFVFVVDSDRVVVFSLEGKLAAQFAVPGARAIAVSADGSDVRVAAGYRVERWAAKGAAGKQSWERVGTM
jgi:sugar lactone lactonase YvrE